MWTTIQRCFLARGLAMSPTGIGLTPVQRAQLDGILACGVTWPRLSRCLAQSQKWAGRPPCEQQMDAFYAAIGIVRDLLGNQGVHHSVRNDLDLVLYIQELHALPAQHPKTVVAIVHLMTDAMSRLAPGLSVLWQEATTSELARKETIEKAGLRYVRHVYPDYTGCDELFYDGPFGPDDPLLFEAEERLKTAI